MMTQRIAALQQSEIHDIVQAIRSFDSFIEENDPHTEHDFGFVQIAQHSVFGKSTITMRACRCIHLTRQIPM